MKEGEGISQRTYMHELPSTKKPVWWWPVEMGVGAGRRRQRGEWGHL